MKMTAKGKSLAHAAERRAKVVRTAAAALCREEEVHMRSSLHAAVGVVKGIL